MQRVDVVWWEVGCEIVVRLVQRFAKVGWVGELAGNMMSDTMTETEKLDGVYRCY